MVLKVVAGQLSEQGFERAVRELRAFAQARSPHLVPILDAGQQGSTLFYAMPHHPLGSLALPARPLTRTEVLRAVACAARAAHALHELGIAHRDIKPENVLLTEDGARLADLGLAQALQPGLTVTGLGPVESVEYVDPAVLLGARASRHSDVYGLGATLHRALAGEGLFGPLPADQPLLAVRAVLSKEPRVSAALTPGDAQLVRDCTAPAAERLPTAAAVAERLDALQSPVVTLPREPTPVG